MQASRLALLLLLTLVVPPAGAQTPIRHCIGTDGRPVFTDQPCATLQATPATATSAASPAPSLRPPAVTCAADADQLREAVIEAFASGDANRLAGLMLWSGYSDHAAVADIRALATLMQRPLVDISAPADAGSADPPADRDATATLVVRTMADDGTGRIDETRFAIEPRSGCLWLRQD